jgi:thiamine-phosphate pyrophosphorylase
LLLIRLDPFYPIVPDTAWLARLVSQGVRLIQLRIKDADAACIAVQIAEAVEFCRAQNCQLVINDYWREAIAAGANFVHLGQDDLAQADLAAIKRAGLRLGISTHSPEELTTALRALPDYVALGPIYATKLKPMPWAPQGLAPLAEWRSQIDGPLVAIGGVTLERAAEVFAAGADSIAVVTDIVTSPDPEARTREWLAATAHRRSLSTGFPQS